MRPRRNRSVGRMTVALTGCLAWLVAASAMADGHIQSITFDPTPRRPDSGDECTIHLGAGLHTPFGRVEVDTPTSRADVRRVKLLLEELLRRSPDMRKKVKDACQKRGNVIVFMIARNDPHVSNGHTFGDRGIAIDPGDVEAADDHMEGKPEDITILANNLLAIVLAHEIDHLREAKGESHSDPATGTGETGPAVDDENRVMQDLGIAVHRNAYGYTDDDDGDEENDDSKIDWTVDGQKVTLNLSELAQQRRRDELGELTDVSQPAPNAISSVPDRPCEEGVVDHCYQAVAAVKGDADGDGVRDRKANGAPKDNCLGLANPQQADTDDDGLGQGCDPDDDGDGWPAALEFATGSSDMCKRCVPEHWSAPDECTDGKDNDRDGQTDADDSSCLVPPADNQRYPEPVAVRALYPKYLRLDLGGVPDGVDALPVTGQMELDLDLDGQADETVELSGRIVIRRDPPIGESGRRRFRLEASAIDLATDSTTFGPLAISQQAERISEGQVFDPTADDGQDYPAGSFVNLFVVMKGPGPDATAGTQDDVSLRNETSWGFFGDLDRWIPLGEDWVQPNGVPAPLFDDDGNRLADIVQATLTVRVAPR